MPLPLPLPPAALALAVVMAGCGAPAPSDAVDGTDGACEAPCLVGDVRVDLTDCAGLTLSMPVTGQPFDLPDGYAASGIQATSPAGAYQLAALQLWECQGSTVQGVDTGPASFGIVEVIIDHPGKGPESDFQHFVVESYATGVMLPAFRAHGFAVAEAATRVTTSATGREGWIDGTGLLATVVHGPPDGGTFGFTSTHHREGGWLHEAPDCQALTPLASHARVEPGSTALRQAEATPVLLSADSQDDDCDLAVEFEAAPA